MAMRKQVVILAVLTLLAVIAATAVLIGERSRDALPERAALFPDMDARFEEVMRIEVADNEQSVAIARDDAGGWTLPAADGYPADRALVRQTLLGFARMRIIEPKTARPDYYERLGLRDLSAGASRARLVRLVGPQDEVIAAVLIGDTAGGAVPGGRSPGGDRAYLRKPGEPQTWLVDGVPQVDARIASWFDDRLLTIPAERVAKITVRHADGETVKLSRTGTDDDWQVAELPKGRTLKSYGGAEATAASLAFLVFDDVRRADRAGQPDAVTTITTFDRITVTAELKDGWLRFAASGGGEAPPPEVEDINSRLAPWAYKLPEYKIDDLFPRLESLLEPEKDAKDS